MEQFQEILDSLEDLSAFTDEQLAETLDAIGEYGRELKKTEATGDELTQLVDDAKALKNAMGVIETELETRAEKREEAEKTKDEAFAAFDDPTPKVEDEPDADGDEEEDEAEEPVQAAAVLRRRGEIRKPVAAEPVEEKPKALVAAAVGVEDYGKSFGDPEEAALALWDAARRGGAGEQAILRIPVDTGTMLSGDPFHNYAQLKGLREGVQKARNEGKALVAAGFCSPAQVVYDFFQASSAGAGIIDLPEANANRGRVTHPSEFGPLQTANQAGIGTEFTAAQDQAAAAKSCFEVVCGTDDLFEVSATYTCLRFSNFDQQFYPERVSHVESEAMVRAAHNTNQRLIEDIVTSPRTTFINELEDGGGSWVTFLRSAARVSHWYRERHKLPTDLVLDMVLPYWFRASLMADTSARGSSELGSLVAAEAAIRAELSKMGVAPQFVYDWQDADQAGSFDGFMSYLMYAPGSVVRLRGGTIDVGVVRDHTLNLANDFSIFVETFDGIAVPGYEVAYVSGVAACPTGATGAAVTITCGGS